MVTNQQTKPLTNTKSQTLEQRGNPAPIELSPRLIGAGQKLQIMQNKPNFHQPRPKNHDSSKKQTQSNPICNFLLLYALLRAFLHAKILPILTICAFHAKNQAARVLLNCFENTTPKTLTNNEIRTVAGLVNSLINSFFGICDIVFFF